jgi:hypothetical protein
MIVTLEWYELDLAAFVGCRRLHESIRNRGGEPSRKDDLTGFDVQDRYDNDIQAAAAEMAVAKGLNLYWDAGINTFKAGDVGPYQVRWTDRVDGRLIIRPDDEDEEIQILVRGRIPTFDIAGAMRCKFAKRDEWWMAPNGRPGAWFVPDISLGPVELLPR